MPPADKKPQLPSIKLSQNVRKAIEKNVGCEEDLIKTLQDVEIKKRVALNELISKKNAFLRQQRRRESLPDVLGRNRTNQALMMTRMARDDLQCSISARLFSKTMSLGTAAKLPSLPVSAVCSDFRTCPENGKEALTTSGGQGVPGKRSLPKQPSEVLLQTIRETKKASERELVPEESSGAVEPIQGVHSQPTSPRVDLGNSILQRRNSAADIVPANNVDTLGWPARQRRQTLHNLFHNITTQRGSDSQPDNVSTPDTSLLQSNAEVCLGDSTLSRYRKVLNRRKSLQAPTFHRSSH